jgi:hypothetical protein
MPTPPARLLRLAVILACLIAAFPAQSESPRQPPGRQLVGDARWALVTDEVFPWHGPALAAGVLVWGHGFSSETEDYRIWRSPAWVKAFSDAGFDIVRFERDPAYDKDVLVSKQRLRTGLTYLRTLGYARVAVSGQSRGGWNALQMMMFPGLQDAVIAISPAAFGAGEQAAADMQNAMTTIDTHIAEPRTRLAFVQFAGDPFAGDEELRAVMVERSWSTKLGGVLMIDRPPGFRGHGGGNGEKFRDAYGACLVRFVMARSLPAPVLHPDRFCAPDAGTE